VRRSRGWECLRFHVKVRCKSGQLRSLTLTLSLSHTHKLLFTHALAHFPIIHSPTYSISKTLTFLLALSLSLWCARACVRVCVSLSPSFSRFRPCILSQAFCLSFSLLITHTLAHTQSHALCLGNRNLLICRSLCPSSIPARHLSVALDIRPF